MLLAVPSLEENEERGALCIHAGYNNSPHVVTQGTKLSREFEFQGHVNRKGQQPQDTVALVEACNSSSGAVTTVGTVDFSAEATGDRMVGR